AFLQRLLDFVPQGGTLRMEGHFTRILSGVLGLAYSHPRKAFLSSEIAFSRLSLTLAPENIHWLQQDGLNELLSYNIVWHVFLSSDNRDQIEIYDSFASIVMNHWLDKQHLEMLKAENLIKHFTEIEE
ncbi:MAG: hypothetical protein P8183_16115, partial [Anaerolineae bacterium]